MLLHDMGEDLADGRPNFLANGREWRTRPLWDGGEALRSKEIFKKLTKKERADLLEFLNSI